MEQDLFRNLPSDTMIDILLRLTPKNISTCKCVCKTWLNLIESDNFHKSHPLVVVVSMPAKDSNRFNVFKLEDEHKEDLITKFNFPQASSTIQGSANGLLLLKDDHKDLYVCNPFTREFVELRGAHTCPRWGDYYGFGVSKITGQHKIVCHNVKTGFQVYALEAGSLWRGVEAANPSFDRCYTSVGAYVSGNLHWLVSNRREIPYVCCFDLETERFSTFSVPPKSIGIKGRLCTLGDYLCFYNDEASYNSFIWLLKEYEQAEKCWIKVMRVPHLGIFSSRHTDDGDYYKIFVHPIKVYRNGDMLLLWEGRHFLYYSGKSRKVRKVDSFGHISEDCWYRINSIHVTPRFLPLKRILGMENIISF